jgi:hypothetical protein
MFVRNAATLFFTVSLLNKDAFAELITITQYPSTCSAIYTTGSRSITIVQSTTTVVPVPYDDAAWNGGTPFVLEIQSDAGTDPLARRADLAGRSWVSLNGSTSTNPSEAGQYYIRSGQLLSINGSYVSTNLNVESQLFSIKTTPGSISTTFTFKDGVLNWTSPRFTGGRAKFCRSPVNLVDNAQVLCLFLGSATSQPPCGPIRLIAKACEEVNPLSSSSAAPTGTAGLSTSMGMQSMSSGPPGQYSPPPHTAPASSFPAGPSASTPPAPYLSSSYSPLLPPLSSPAAYTSAPSSVVLSSRSPSATSTRTSSSSPAGPPSYVGPPIYGSPTPSPALTSSAVSSSSVISFAPSGSPIGPLNPPLYGSTRSSSGSSSSSMSISSGGVRSSASSSSMSSSIVLPPIYPSQTPLSSTAVMSPARSSSALSSSSSSVSLPPTISFASSESRPPVYTPPAVTPSPTRSSSVSSSSSVSIPASSNLSLPVVYPGDSSTSRSSSTAPSSSVVSSSTTLQVASSSSFVSPPIYTGTAPQSCPQGNNSVYINAANNVYTIYCGLDSFPNSYTAPIVVDFTTCIQRCDFDPECGAVSHTDSNFCYFKPTPLYYVSGNITTAVRLAGAPVYPGASSSSSLSALAPPQYETTMSSSMAPSSSSSSVSSSMSSPIVSSSMMSSTSSNEVPAQYQGPTTTPTTTTSSSMSSSSSVEVPDQYEQTITTTTTTSTSSSAPITTTTTTSTSSPQSSSSSAASTTIPYSAYLVLPSPTPCDFGDPPNYDEDDSYCEIDLPFSIQLYGTSSSRTYPASNGFIGLNRGSQQFQVSSYPYSGIPENTIGPFFDDLELYGKKNPRQGIYYQIDGGKVTYEWYVGRSAQAQADKDRLSQSIYHFTMAYDSAVPNTFVYTYYAVGDTARNDGGVNGAYAAVGMQGCKLLQATTNLCSTMLTIFVQWTAAAQAKARRTRSDKRRLRRGRK